MAPLIAVIQRDITLALRDGAGLGTALGFYLIVVTMLPLGLGPDMKLLSRIAPGMLWIALLLAALLSITRLFEADHEDGSLELLATGELPLEIVVAAKAFAHWVTTAIPLAVATPVLGLLLNLDLNANGPLLATMLAGTPAISFLGAIGAALTLKARRGGLLIALLVLPLYIPTLIFGISAISAITLDTGAFEPSILILLAISLMSIVLAPIAAAAALKAQLG
ncbi:MAG: heme exporter protein CcmB [Hyphomicrobiaceae bacterium]|nr:heme exporter protein CcmB [Hyphomicrobiaceae bacterium]